MAEVVCAACNGSGLIATPHTEPDANGNPITINSIGTCSTCFGNGRVQQ